MGDLPSTIPFVRVVDALAGLGIDIVDAPTRNVTFGIDGVTVERARVLADGKHQSFGHDIATVTTEIAYDREGDA